MGVEFTKLGQFGMLGRYPVHFHMFGDASSSIVPFLLVYFCPSFAFVGHIVLLNLG